MNRLLAVAAATVIAAGCGSRCKEVSSARTALASRAAATNRGADVRVTVPIERANTLIADLLREKPLTVSLDPPDIGPLEIKVRGGLTATAREVRVLPGPPGRIRFAMRIEIRDADAEITTLALVTEVEPKLERKDGAAELAIGFGPENLMSVEPELGPDAAVALGDAVSRWVPEKLRAKLPRPVLDAAAKRLGSYLTGAAYKGLRLTLLQRLGELTRLRLRLPDVPVADVAIRSVDKPTGVLIVEILTDLPVRRGLAPTSAVGDDVSVAFSGSAVTELANWAIEHGHAPRWYDRGLTPRPDGEFSPHFDYVAEDTSHPFKVYAFQERGGCSYFRVGVRATVAMDGANLSVLALDRELEQMSANPVIEAAAWMKFFLFGSLDRSKQIAAHTRLTLDGRTLDSRVTEASLVHDELRFALRFSAGAPPAP